jgi:Na+/proline symporter
MLNSTTGILIFLGYGLFIIALVWYTKKPNETSDDFLIMNRSMGVFRGSLSMAVSWIWAPAVFICSMQAFNQGLPGIFWFTLPNILTFFVFAPFAIRMRKKFPEGYTISQIFKISYGNSFAHKISLVVTVGYQLGAIIINCVAGATLINLLSGIPYTTGVLLMGGLSLGYSLISGLRASVLTDVAQMLMVVIIALLIVPWSVMEIGGYEQLKDGFAGVTGEFGNVFDPGIAYSFGIATSIGLISGPVADQMFSQRAFAAKKGSIGKIFVIAGLLFGIVPITLSLLGFVGASGVRNNLFEIIDPQMVGPEVIGNLLPSWALGVFAIMAFAGLTSTLDSAFSAIGSISAIDIKPDNGREETNLNSKVNLKVARTGMSISAILGMGIALLQPQLLWVFLIYGALASSLFLPAFLLLFWKKLTKSGAFWGILSGVIVGTPLSIFANVSGETDLIVLSAILGLMVGGVIAVVVSLSSNRVA